MTHEALFMIFVDYIPTRLMVTSSINDGYIPTQLKTHLWC